MYAGRTSKTGTVRIKTDTLNINAIDSIALLGDVNVTSGTPGRIVNKLDPSLAGRTLDIYTINVVDTNLDGVTSLVVHS